MSRRAVVLGLGRSGVACARVLAEEGLEVIVVDRGDGEDQRRRAAGLPAGITVQLGGYDSDVVIGADIVCPSPGVRWDAPELELARAGGASIRSEISLFFERCTGHICGITGTNGKTTTTALTADVLRAGGLTVHRGGNIGETVLDRVGDIIAGDWVVLELSSFQLESMDNPRCDIGCVLNLTPDHLDRHLTMDNYGAIKRRITDAAHRRAVLGADDEATRAMAGSAMAAVSLFGLGLGDADGATVEAGEVVIREAGARLPVMPVDDIPLFGAHNVLNVLASCCIAHAAGVDPVAMAAGIRGFNAVEHRLQPIADVDGVLWVNDSKATNVDAAIKALQSFPERSIVWIGGGSHKGVGPEVLAAEVSRRARVAIAIGATGPELAAALTAAGAEPHLVSTLGEAVELARQVAQSGDVVLLAPGYASFDQYTNFEERGHRFVELATAASMRKV